MLENIEKVKLEDIKFKHYNVDLKELKELTELLLKNGYQVIATDPKDFKRQGVNYIFFSKDKKYYGYAQQTDLLYELEYQTEHKGNIKYGTGRVLTHLKGVSLENAEKTIKATESDCKHYNLNPDNFDTLTYVEVVL